MNTDAFCTRLVKTTENAKKKKKQWKILRMKVNSVLTSTNAAQGLKHKLRRLSLKHFT
jgi:hypothetical protein